ncbi:hypothetical protein ACH347_16880 [Saccharopolyspora sp. 5N102]|uniref:hypothetical protein n=1 Tax=Saccharopolyspora sp. 5N102 TaxID=3375155 RepID=UPI003799D753
MAFASEGSVGGLREIAARERRGAVDDVGAVDDGLERSLLRANELIETAVHEHRRRSSQSSFVMVGLDEDLRCTVEEMVARAERSVCIAVSLPSDGELLCLTTGIGAEVGVRVLSAPQALRVDRAVEMMRRPECEIKLSRSPLQGVVLVDGRLALLRSNAGAADRQASIIRLPAVVRALESLFVASWDTGRPLPDHLLPLERRSVEPVRRILEHLRAGHTDSQSAQKLGISLRTYRRQVACIMQELGAKSRFQAGALAVEAGLLDARGPAQDS